MNTLQALSPLFAAGTLVICGCGARPVVLPAASTIETAFVSWGMGGEHKLYIQDQKSLDDFVAFVNSLDSGWYTPWHTFPVPRYTFSLEERDGELHTLWLGVNWIGGRDPGEYAPSNRLRDLSENERAELLRALGLSEDGCRRSLRRVQQDGESPESSER